MNSTLDFDCLSNFHFKGKRLFGWKCFASLENVYQEIRKKALPEVGFQTTFHYKHSKKFLENSVIFETISYTELSQTVIPLVSVTPLGSRYTKSLSYLISKDCRVIVEEGKRSLASSTSLLILTTELHHGWRKTVLLLILTGITTSIHSSTTSSRFLLPSKNFFLNAA